MKINLNGKDYKKESTSKTTTMVVTWRSSNSRYAQGEWKNSNTKK